MCYRQRLMPNLPASRSLRLYQKDIVIIHVGTNASSRGRNTDLGVVAPPSRQKGKGLIHPLCQGWFVSINVIDQERPFFLLSRKRIIIVGADDKCLQFVPVKGSHFHVEGIELMGNVCNESGGFSRLRVHDCFSGLHIFLLTQEVRFVARVILEVVNVGLKILFAHHASSFVIVIIRGQIHQLGELWPNVLLIYQCRRIKGLSNQEWLTPPRIL